MNKRLPILLIVFLSLMGCSADTFPPPQPIPPEGGSNTFWAATGLDSLQLPQVFGHPVQVGYVVDDLDRTIQQWHSEYGIGPFLVTRGVTPLKDAYYRGRKSPAAPVDIAFAYVGNIQIELIAPLDDTPSMYREAIERQDVGVHHYGVLVEDFPSAYSRALEHGFQPLVDSGIDGLARMSYMENPGSDLRLEIIQWNGLTRPYFDAIRNRIDAADSGQLIHEFELEELKPGVAAVVPLLSYGLNRLLGNIESTMPQDADH